MNNYPKVIKKRSGRIAQFDLGKIMDALSKANYAAGAREAMKAEETAEKVALRLNEEFSGMGKIPTVDDSNACCVAVLRELGFDRTADKFESYSADRSRIRQLNITKKKDAAMDITDQMLLVQSVTEEIAEPFNREKLAGSLAKEYKLTQELAEMVAKETENTAYNLADSYGVGSFDTRMISRMAENHLIMLGIPVKHSALSMPFSTVESLVFSSSKENSNISSNNPEAINLGIAEYILKRYGLSQVFSEEVAEAHNNGVIHIHDLGYPQRVYCSSHSVEYIKKYGLEKVVANLQNKSTPAKSAWVLNGHIQTFLASMQSRYAGALGFGFLNILFAPMLDCPELFVKGELNGKETYILKDRFEEMEEAGLISDKENKDGIPYFKKTGESYRLHKFSAKQMKQIAQNLIFSASQNAFSRGGQTLFIDFNIHTGVPQYLRNVPVVGPGGKYLLERGDGSIEFRDEAPRFRGAEGDSRNGDAVDPGDGSRYITYGDPRMEQTARDFAIELMKVWEAGDKYGIQFAFPKCDLHVSRSAFENKEDRMVFEAGCRLAAKNGSTYFMFDRDGAGATLAQCCRLKERVTDPYLLKHPEKIRFTGFQNVTINLPQAAFRGKTLNGTLTEINRAMDLAMKAHMQKRAYIQKLLDTPGSPLRALGVPSDDGDPYVDLKKATYIIGLIGLNEAVQYLTGKELHESKGAFETGLLIVDKMYQKVDALRKEYNLKITLEETPAESATQKLAKGDLVRFASEARKVVKGDLKKAPYYTNSIHLDPGADVSITDRIEMQAKFHDMIESGSIIHVYCGERQIPAESIAVLMEKAYRQTRATQITVSPEFTHCSNCHANYNGFKDKCEKCGSTEVVKRTKIVGYFSNLDSWNDSQLEISKAREAAAANYANMLPTVGWLHEKDGSVKVMVFGKSGCSSCEGAEKHLKSLLNGHKDIPVEFYDMTRADSRLEAARWNVPLDPIPTVIVKNGRDVRRFEPEFRHGKQLVRKETDYAKMLESVCAVK